MNFDSLTGFLVQCQLPFCREKRQQLSFKKKKKEKKPERKKRVWRKAYVPPMVLLGVQMSVYLLWAWISLQTLWPHQHFHGFPCHFPSTGQVLNTVFHEDWLPTNIPEPFLSSSAKYRCSSEWTELNFHFGCKHQK